MSTAIQFFGGTITKGMKIPKVSFFGALSGIRKYAGGALGVNGKIYCVPRQASKVLEIDTVNKTTTLIGPDLSGGNEKYTGAIAHPNGKIYGIPRNANPVLEIDPLTGTVTTTGTNWLISAQWFGGILHPNGKIYGIPSARATFLEFDPSIGDGVLVGSVTGRYLGAILGENEKIYCIPQDTNAPILEFDPVDYSADYFSSIPNGAFGAVLDLNGHISLITQNKKYMQLDYINKSVLKDVNLALQSNNVGVSMFPSGIVTGIGAPISSVVNPSNGRFKTFNIQNTDGFYGSVMGVDGKIYGVPWGANQVIELDYEDAVTPEMYTMPPLNQLASSLYNKYQNKF